MVGVLGSDCVGLQEGVDGAVFLADGDGEASLVDGDDDGPADGVSGDMVDSSRSILELGEF